MREWTLHLRDGRTRRIDRPLVMGILNATPDSFSDGGDLAHPVGLDARIGAMLQEGADILDVGGESTRPGHEPVPAEDERRRVVPVVRAVRTVDAQIPISIDTQKAAVAQAALDAGADLVNDVSGLADPRMGEVVRAAGCTIIAMRDQDLALPVVDGCRAELADVLRRTDQAGIDRDQVVLDPGLGFGDPPGGDPASNLALVDHVRDYDHGRPVLIGASRKRFIGTWMDEPEPKRRVAGSVAVARRAVAAGAAIVRVHDVDPTVEALAASS